MEEIMVITDPEGNLHPIYGDEFAAKAIRDMAREVSESIRNDLELH